MLDPEFLTTIIWISILNVVAVTLMVLLLVAVVVNRGLHLTRARNKQDQA